MTDKPEKPAHPEFTPIESSMLSGYHYEPETRALTVKYKKTGQVYRYSDVGIDKFATLTGGAASPGTYFNQQIKDKHKAEKL